MVELFFFILGFVNSCFLIFIFLIRKDRTSLLQRIGWMYLLLAIPAVYGIFLVAKEKKTARYSIFLAVFLAFLALEWLLDYVLKIPFRENMKQNLIWVVPYLSLYYSMNYGFVVMPWKTSSVWGGIMLGLFIVQLVVNLMSHPKMEI